MMTDNNTENVSLMNQGHLGASSDGDSSMGTRSEFLKNLQAEYNLHSTSLDSQAGDDNQTVTVESCQSSLDAFSETSENELFQLRKALAAYQIEFAKRDLERSGFTDKIRSLEEEVENVSSLLAETVSSVRENKAQENRLQENSRNRPFKPSTFAGGIMGLGRLGRRRRLSRIHGDISVEEGGDGDEVQQLEKICKVHQFTILKQRKEMTNLRQIIEENGVEIDSLNAEIKTMAEDSKADEVKISVLESQFIELNEAKEAADLKASSTPKSSGGVLTPTSPTSIIQIDAAYVSTLKSNAFDNSITIQELKTELEKQQAENKSLNEKLELEEHLRKEIAALTIKVEARDSTISAMETVECNELRKQLSSKEAQISKLQSHLSTLERRTNDVTTPGAKKQNILSIRQVSLLQEKLDVCSWRLNHVLNRIEDAKYTSSDKNLMLSVCDKALLMQNHIKVSLGLLESQLSNQMASTRLNDDNCEENNVILARFDQTLKSLRESEIELKRFLRELKADIDKQNIQVIAKDGVIEDLMKNEKITNVSLESLQSELDILRSLSNYSSIDEGILSKFRERAKLDSENQEKDRIINRLNNIIDVYRAQECHA